MPRRDLPTPVLVALAVVALALTGGACALCLMPWGPATEEPPPTPATQWPAPGASLPGSVDSGPSAADDGPQLGGDAPADTSTPDAPPDTGCAPGFDTCGQRVCIALASTREHCGGCQYTCPAWSFCIRGACAPSWNLADNCPPGGADCDRMEATGCEVDLRSNRFNCGACGEECGPRADCREGRCVLP